ncbi:hypothetical protein J6590_014092 [Homalodisca vitripennis]|nr:hypothetical protein J6590_014092 [Homalodisca vitripennis]
MHSSPFISIHAPPPSWAGGVRFYPIPTSRDNPDCNTLIYYHSIVPQWGVIQGIGHPPPMVTTHPPDPVVVTNLICSPPPPINTPSHGVEAIG